VVRDTSCTLEEVGAPNDWAAQLVAWQADKGVMIVN
jgi:hypothetical protein